MRAFRLLPFLLLLILGVGHANAAATPDAYIESLGAEVIAILKDTSLDQASREAQFRTMLEANVDTESTSRTVLGRYWSVATDAQRQEFQQLYREYLIKIYAARFSGFSGQTFDVKGSRAGPDKDVVVLSTINPAAAGGATYTVNWRVRPVGDGFRIVDVMAEGVSLLVTHNQEFSSVIQNNGGRVDALLAALRKRMGRS